MKNYVRLIVEEYFNNTEQMDMSMKRIQADLKKADKAYDSRHEFLAVILGKVTYNKYTKGSFAPVPLSALHLQYEDLYYLFTENVFKKDILSDEAGYERVKKLLTDINKVYTQNEFKFVDNGVTYLIHTNIVFKTLDDIIDFLMTIKKSVKRIQKSEDINWKTIVKKFRNYLK